MNVYLICSKTITQAAIVAFFSNLADVGLHGSMMVFSYFHPFLYLFYTF